MIHQLRVYEIFEDTADAFLARFRDHAMRIMRGYGFDFAGTWQSRDGDRLEFVYLLRWPDEATMRDAWQRFRADQEWADIKRSAAATGLELVGDIRERTLVPV